jgi:hypothetical protein
VAPVPPLLSRLVPRESEQDPPLQELLPLLVRKLLWISFSIVKISLPTETGMRIGGLKTPLEYLALKNAVIGTLSFAVVWFDTSNGLHMRKADDLRLVVSPLLATNDARDSALHPLPR